MPIKEEWNRLQSTKYQILLDFLFKEYLMGGFIFLNVYYSSILLPLTTWRSSVTLTIKINLMQSCQKIT